MDTQLAFLGIGRMGQAMTANLVSKTHLLNPLILYNRSRQRADEHSSKIGHSIVVSTFEEAVSRSNIIWTCLQDQEAVLETFAQILTSDIDVKGKLFLDCSTILPEITTQLGQRILDHGAEFVAMPVFGEPDMARKGLLICVSAGAPSSVERIKPYLMGVIGRAVVDLSGEEPAKASLLKCIGNVLIMTTIDTIAEAYVFAENSGLGTGHMASLIDTMFPQPPHTVYSRMMKSGEYYTGESIVEVAKAKALTYQILELASASKTSLKSYEVAIERLATAEIHAGPKCDIVGIYGAVRIESGLPFRNGDSPNSCVRNDKS